jgi:hypothetical protein
MTGDRGYQMVADGRETARRQTVEALADELADLDMGTPAGRERAEQLIWALRSITAAARGDTLAGPGPRDDERARTGTSPAAVTDRETGTGREGGESVKGPSQESAAGGREIARTQGVGRSTRPEAEAIAADKEPWARRGAEGTGRAGTRGVCPLPIGRGAVT